VKVAIFSEEYDREFLSTANASHHDLGFFEAHLIRRRMPLCERLDKLPG
jgi:hypothetical protein